MRDHNLSWYEWHTGHEVGRRKLVENLIKKYLIWMLILFVREIYFDNCLMIFGLGIFCNDLLVISLLLCSAVWQSDILTYFKKTSTQYFAVLHQWLWCLRIAEDSLVVYLSFLFMSLNITFHGFKYFIVHLTNMLSLFIQYNISVLNDITCLLAQKQFNGNESQEYFPCKRILLNIQGCTILPKSRSHLKILGMGRGDILRVHKY